MPCWRKIFSILRVTKHITIIWNENCMQWKKNVCERHPTLTGKNSTDLIDCNILGHHLAVGSKPSLMHCPQAPSSTTVDRDNRGVRQPHMRLCAQHMGYNQRTHVAQSKWLASFKTLEGWCITVLAHMRSKWNLTEQQKWSKKAFDTCMYIPRIASVLFSQWR